MKKLLVVLGIWLAGCASTENHLQRTPQNEMLIMQFVDASIKGDFDEMRSLLADSFKLYGPALGDSTDAGGMIARDRKAWTEDFSSIAYDRYAILSVSMKEGRVKGDWVLDWGKVTFNYKNGRTPVTFWYHCASRVKSGKIEIQRIFYDGVDIANQLKGQPAPMSLEFN